MNQPGFNNRQRIFKALLLWIMVLGPFCTVVVARPENLSKNLTGLAFLATVFLLVQFSNFFRNLYLLLACLSGLVASTYTPFSALAELLSQNHSLWQMGFFILIGFGLVAMACYIMFRFYQAHVRDIREGK